MNWVLDTSAAFQIILKGKYYGTISPILHIADSVLAPNLFISEVGNVLWKYVRYRNMDMSDAETLLPLALNLIHRYEDSRIIIKDSFGLAITHQISVYDAIYLKLALHKGNCGLLTMDKKLSKVATEMGIEVPLKI